MNSRANSNLPSLYAMTLFIFSYGISNTPCGLFQSFSDSLFFSTKTLEHSCVFKHGDASFRLSVPSSTNRQRPKSHLMAYTQAGLAIGHEDVGKPDRFIKKYGLPRGREGLSKSSLDSQYQVKRTLDAGVTNGGVGGLSEGVDLVVKKSAPRKNQICVLKRIGIRPDDHALLKREIELLHVLKHPNVVGFVDGYIPASLDGQAHLVMEYCDQGNLSDLIQNYVRRNKLNPHQPPAHIPEAFLWHVFESLASALAYIHYGVKGDDLRNPSVPLGKDKWPNILHRDVKPDNIFLQSSSFSGGAEPRPSGTRVPQFLSSRSISRLSSSASSGSASAGRNASSYPRVVLADFVSRLHGKWEPWHSS